MAAVASVLGSIWEAVEADLAFVVALVMGSGTALVAAAAVGLVDAAGTRRAVRIGWVVRVFLALLLNTF